MKISSTYHYFPAYMVGHGPTLRVLRQRLLRESAYGLMGFGLLGTIRLA
ncbi:MAG: hypothetical protein ABW124_18110 [Candidatus Thiodiazotropha sp. 6PLUC9]